MKFFRQHPALTLFLVAPVFGELFSGSTPLNEFINPISFFILAMLYGCGAIIVRELVVRWKKGWLGLLLLGFAYGIFEEGLMVRSFFDPNWVDLGSLGVYGRVFGVNWVWVYHLTIFHALVSIVSSIVFVEVLYPEQRAASWVTSSKWMRVNGALLLLTLPLGKMMTPYNAPDGWILLSWLAIFALLGLARLTPNLSLPPRRKAPPGPQRFFWLAFVGTFIHHILIYMGADEGAYPFPVALLLTALFDLFVLRLALRWSGNFTVWDDRHRAAFINGLLSFFLVIGALNDGSQYPIMYLSNPVFLFLLWLYYRKIRQRTESEAASRVPL